MRAADNNNDVRVDDHNRELSKRFFLDEVLKSQRPVPVETTPEREFVTPPDERRTSESPIQENPMDLSVKSDGRSSSARRRSDDSSVHVDQDDVESVSCVGSGSDDDQATFAPVKRIKLHPLDLTTKV